MVRSEGIHDFREWSEELIATTSGARRLAERRWSRIGKIAACGASLFFFSFLFFLFFSFALSESSEKKGMRSVGLKVPEATVKRANTNPNCPSSIDLQMLCFLPWSS